MSMKFLSGLQDLLGLYDSAAGTNASTSSSSTAIPPTTFFPSHTSRPSSSRSIQDINNRSSIDEDGPIQRCSHDRVVHFADEVVTGYCDAPTSPFRTVEVDMMVPTSSSGALDPNEIQQQYRDSCQRHHVKPNQAVIRQIGFMHRMTGLRQEIMSLKGEKVSAADIESMEAIFRRVQFDILDFEYTFLDDDAVVALAEMLEFYDSTTKLNLSFNRQINQRGWSAVFRAVKNCHSLTMLHLRYTSVESSMVSLSKCLKAPAPALTCLHLENVGLAGKSLLMLVSALKSNTVLKELYLGDNGLQPTDGVHLYQLIINNTGLQMLDLRNNELGDSGLRHICDAMRNTETLSHSAISTLVLWNNRITEASMEMLCMVLKENGHLDTLNIGSNTLGTIGIQLLKPALATTTYLHRLGLQKTKMNCQAAIVLAECLADNTAIVRVDLRENPDIGSAGLLALHSAMKMNDVITLMNLDQTCAVATSEKVRPYQEEFRRYYDEIRQKCEHNKQAALGRMTVKTEDIPKIETKEESPAPKPEEPTCCSAAAAAEVVCEPATCRKTAKPTRFCRSSSLTCAETVTDIQERIREMSGSTLSLDETSSTKTIRKPRFSVTPTNNLVEWGSLPAIPQAVQAETLPSNGGTVRKLRRFSVSPASSATDLNKPVSIANPLERPCSLTIDFAAPPVTNPTSATNSGPSSIPNSLDLWSWQRRCTTVAEHSSGGEDVPRTSSCPDLTENGTIVSKKSRCCGGKRSMETRIEWETNKEDVVAVVADIVNYVVYEETSANERKASILLGYPGLQFIASDLVSTPTSGLSTPSTPSRTLDSVLEDHDDSDNDVVVRSVVRGIVRQVLQKEKDSLRSTLERRRRQLAANQFSS